MVPKKTCEDIQRKQKPMNVLEDYKKKSQAIEKEAMENVTKLLLFNAQEKDELKEGEKKRNPFSTNTEGIETLKLSDSKEKKYKVLLKDLKKIIELSQKEDAQM